MFFLNEDIGWIQKVKNYYTPLNTYRTTNGGILWIPVDSKYQYMRNSFKNSGKIAIDFINDSLGFMVSVDSILYKTSDKGENWQLLSNEYKFSEVNFVNKNIGYSSASTGIYKTTNGGSRWYLVIESIENLKPYLGAVINENRVIIHNQYIHESYFLTTNGGITWNKKVVAGGMNTHWLNGIIFVDSLHGYSCLSLENQQDSSYMGIYRSSNGGDSWYLIANSTYWDISMGDSLNGVGFYREYGYFLTNDGFKTIKRKSNLSAYEYSFKSCKDFYACGDSGYFAKSTDCGETWTKLPFVFSNPLTSMRNNIIAPKYSLDQNYPNPFNPSTRISYSLLHNGMTTIKIYDVLGKEIITLVNKYQTSGNHYVDFKAEELNSGVYFYKINSGEFSKIKKMVLLK